MSQISRMAPKVALDVVLTPRLSQQQVVHAFLSTGVAFVNEETETLQWFGIKFDAKEDGSAGGFGIFDTFPGEKGRVAHLNGKLAARLMAHADELLSVGPKVDPIEIIASKVSAHAAGNVKYGVRVIIKAKSEKVQNVRIALEIRGEEVQNEAVTPYWYAIREDETTFGLVGFFNSEEDRAVHIQAVETQSMMTGMGPLLDGSLEVYKFEVIASKTSGV
ncbi:hypothetical protein BC834DRAFT_847415 [Gloeopeniophorella convolvens]|nr:hypothetical protein BC834DRAFT_847415 [Gloeopeniophorella convolvens]